MKVSVIIPCWVTTAETLNLTQLAIESLPESHLIIVDNASTLGAGYLRSVADTYVREKTNYGYARAVNDGIVLARTPYICISNNDIRVPKNIFSVALEIFKDKSIGSVHFYEIFYDAPFYNGDKVWKTGKERWCTSSFFILRSRALKDCGLYDEKFDGRGTYDDYDFWHRFRHINGWKTAYTTKAQYQHWGSHSFQVRGQKQREKYDEINRQYFISKWGKDPDTLFSKIYPKQWQINYADGFK